jgi:protein pelota
MRQLFSHVEKNGSGLVGLIATDPEDLWQAFNLIHEGDYVQTTSYRRVISESSSGSTRTERIKTKLRLKVRKY